MGKIGKHSYGTIGNPIGLNTYDLTIGNFVSIAHNVNTCGPDHHHDWISNYPFLAHEFTNTWTNSIHIKNKGIQPHIYHGDIIIKNDVWIGYGVILRPGITIGNGVVIATGSVVVKDVPDYAIVGGVPAEVIRYRFSEEDILYLLKLKWWDWDDSKINENLELICSSNIQLLKNKFPL